MGSSPEKPMSWQRSRVVETASVMLLALIVGCSGSTTTSRPSSSPPASRTTTDIAAPTATSVITLPPSDPPAPVEEMRGMLSPSTFWDQTFDAATSSDCSMEGADIIEAQRAWRLSSGALACTMDPSGPAWNGHVTGVNLYFDPKVNADNALAAVASILPPDAQQIQSVIAENNVNSKYSNGSCQYVLYSSDLLAAAVRQVSPSWTGDPHLIAASLYTDNADSSDGSNRQYTPGAVHLGLVSIADSANDAGC